MLRTARVLRCPDLGFVYTPNQGTDRGHLLPPFLPSPSDTSQVSCHWLRTEVGEAGVNPARQP